MKPTGQENPPISETLAAAIERLKREKAKREPLLANQGKWEIEDVQTTMDKNS